MKLSECTKCSLCKTRTQVVLPSGSWKRANVMLIGEAPGKNEDLKGKPLKDHLEAKNHKEAMKAMAIF